MLTAWINISRVRMSGTERLYPRDLDWSLAPGVNAVIGGTGLGKTTLVYAIQFAVLGKLIIDADERIESEFFAGRLTKRGGKDLKDNPPRAQVDFTAGDSEFTVVRNLLSGALLECTQDGKALTVGKYEERLPAALGLGKDFPSLGLLQGSLLFFGERRYLLAWENKLQNELINLMMADHDAYSRLAGLWKKVESADSFARNVSAQISRFENDLIKMDANQSRVGELQHKYEAKNFRAEREGVEARLAVVQGRLTDERKILAKLTDQVAQAHARFHRELDEFESAQSADFDDELLAAALADPSVASIRRALQEFYTGPERRSCPCCGRPGLAESMTRLAQTAAASAKAGHCVACSKPLPSSKAGHAVRPAVSVNTAAQAEDLQSLLFQQEQARSRINELHQDEGRLLRQVADARSAELRNAKEDPSSAVDLMRITIQQMEKREQLARKECEGHMAALQRELKKTDSVFTANQQKIAKAFQKYASLYLDEPCEVKLLEAKERPGKHGPQVKAPHASFVPIISGEIRPKRQALSDAQRSFVDLAFRMAVIDVWHQMTGKTVTLIVETPEGATDLAYMERVATMIRTFGAQGHTLIITTNLNNDTFLPELMAAWPKAKRTAHIVNLIEQGSPRPVQIAHRPRFQKIIHEVVARSVAG